MPQKGLPSGFIPIEEPEDIGLPSGFISVEEHQKQVPLSEVKQPPLSPHPHLTTPIFGGYEKPIESMQQSITNKIGLSNLPDWAKGPAAAWSSGLLEIPRSLLDMISAPESPAAMGVLTARGELPIPRRVTVEPPSLPKRLMGEVGQAPPSFTEGEFTVGPELPKGPKGLGPAQDIQLGPSGVETRLNKYNTPNIRIKKPQVPSAPIRAPFSTREQVPEPFAFKPTEPIITPPPSTLGPEYAPVGGEPEFNINRPVTPIKSMEQQQFDIAREKFNMARDLPTEQELSAKTLTVNPETGLSRELPQLSRVVDEGGTLQLGFHAPVTEEQIQGMFPNQQISISKVKGSPIFEGVRKNNEFYKVTFWNDKGSIDYNASKVAKENLGGHLYEARPVEPESEIPLRTPQEIPLLPEPPPELPLNRPEETPIIPPQPERAPFSERFWSEVGALGPSGPPPINEPPKTKFGGITGQGISNEWKFTNPQGEPPSLKDIIDASRIQRNNIEKYQPKWKKLSALNAITKNLRSTIDFSIPFRQGYGFVGRPFFWKNLVPMIRAAGPEFFEAAQDAIFNDPEYEMAHAAGLQFLGGPEGSKSDFFPKSSVENWWGVKNTSQSAAFFTNKTRLDAWKMMTKSLSDARMGKYNPRKNMVVAEEIAQFINTYTGKGDFGRWERHVPLMNSFLFSAPLAKSRLDMFQDMFNPATYVRDSWEVRKEKLRSLFSMAAFAVTGATMAAYAGADVSLDPEDSDFLKIKVGNSRLDLLGGIQQYGVAAAKMIMWANKEMNGEKVERFKTGYDIAKNFIENKETPLVAFAKHILEGRSFGRKTLNIPKEIIDLFIPMVSEDTVEMIRDDPRQLWMIPLGILGAGVQTYDKENPPGEDDDTIEGQLDSWIRDVVSGLIQ